MVYYWLQLYRMSWYPEKKLSFVVMHAMVLPVRIDTSTSSQISVLKLVPLTWMKPAGNIYFSAGNILSHSPMQAWSQSVCARYISRKSQFRSTTTNKVDLQLYVCVTITKHTLRSNCQGLTLSPHQTSTVDITYCNVVVIFCYETS